MKLELTTIDFPGMDDVIVTEGMTDATGHKIYGVFADEADAASIDADSLALGTVGADALTAEQIEMAERNRDALEQEDD